MLTLELVGAKYAAAFSILVNVPFVLGEVYLILIAYLFRDFRHMLRVAFAPAYIGLLTWFFVPESPRWLLANDK